MARVHIVRYLVGPLKLRPESDGQYAQHVREAALVVTFAGKLNGVVASELRRVRAVNG
jgi:hypothetical protein